MLPKARGGTRAGIREGDKILAIDNAEVTGCQ